jgi:hypothetical protein
VAVRPAEEIRRVCPISSLKEKGRQEEPSVIMEICYRGDSASVVCSYYSLVGPQEKARSTSAVHSTF